MLKGLKLGGIVCEKEWSKILTSSSIEKTSATNWSDIKRYEKIRKLTTGQDYFNRCLFDYDYIKNHYRLKADDLRRQKEVDTDVKAIQHLEFVRK